MKHIFRFLLFLSLIVFLGALVDSLSAAPFRRKPAPKPVVPAVAPAVAAPAPEPAPLPEPETPRFTVNPDGSVLRSKQADAELHDWIEGIQKEAELQKARGDKGDAALGQATTRADSFQKEVQAVTDDRNTQAAAKDAALISADQWKAKADYWAQKDKEAVSKLWWWRIRGWGAIILGGLLIAGGLLIRFTSWGAKTLGPLVARAAVVAILAASLTSCAHRQPVVVLIKAVNGEVFVPPPGYWSEYSSTKDKRP